MPERTERTFLGWDEPALMAASRWLLDRARGEGEADLGGMVVVVPGGRARRMLLGALVDEAAARGVALTPPTAITPGEIPGALLGAPGRPAPSIARRLAWVDALRSFEGDALAALLPRPLAPEDLPGWSRIGAALERASDELAGEGLRFGDVAETAGDLLPAEEVERWAALALVQERAVELLEERGLVDEALATLAQAIKGAPASESPKPVVLLGTPELNKVERLAIQRGASSVDALVFAPESFAGRFDQWGCVDGAAWGAAPVDLAEERVAFADDPGDQAERALAHLAQRGGPVDVGEVVIGLADPEALARLRRRAATSAGVTVRSAQGEALARTPPGRLLRLLGAFLREPSFESLLALVRHPDVERALLAQGGDGEAAQTEWWLESLDEIRREHVLTDPSAAPASLWPRRREALAAVTEGVARLLGDDLRAPGAARPVHEWSDAIGGGLSAVYAGRALRPDVDAERLTIEALEAIRGALDELAEATSDETATAAQAIGLIEERLASQFAPEAVRREAIETLGWLELALDPAPRCVVVGLADSCVPGSVTHDALLPESLRARLGLRTNEARLGRDAFLLSAINASRDAVFFASRRGDEGDPSTPSRLLFRCAGATLSRRVRRFAEPKFDRRPSVRLASRLAPGERDLFMPALVVGPEYAPPAAMAVTDFGSYLRSPAGWYLERCLGLEEHEAPREMSAMHFGNLAHGVLERFGRDEGARDLDDPERIEQALCDMLSTEARRTLGDAPPATVRIQVELLRERLRLFAPWQADRRREGWRITHVEWKPPKDAPPALDVDGEPMGLRGKIDRVDIHEPTGRMALIDYKTGRVSAKALSDHRRRDGRWTSLQLPLYRLLAAPIGHTGEIELGYARLPSKEADKSAWKVDAWPADVLDEADEAAREVVRGVRALRPGAPVPLGDSPPDGGSLGFVTGARFDFGGAEGEVDESAEAAS